MAGFRALKLFSKPVQYNRAEDMLYRVWAQARPDLANEHAERQERLFHLRLEKYYADVEAVKVYNVQARAKAEARMQAARERLARIKAIRAASADLHSRQYFAWREIEYITYCMACRGNGWIAVLGFNGRRVQNACIACRATGKRSDLTKPELAAIKYWQTRPAPRAEHPDAAYPYGRGCGRPDYVPL